MNYLLERLPSIAALAGALGVLWAVEWVRPLRRRRQRLGARLLPNAAMTAAGFAVSFALLRPMAAGLSGWAAGQRFGLLQWIPFPGHWGIVQFAAGLLLMDASFYLWHRANHEVPLLWRFHNVHHVDLDVDVTTSFRFHPVEILYSAGFRVAQVALLGVTWPIYLTYETAFTLATMFQHTNVRFPLAVERALNWIFVTPRMHGVHHSVVRNETNSNYGTVFRWWDALARSLVLAVPQGEVTIGVAGYLGEPENRLWRLVAMPFTRQRDYGRLPDGTMPDRSERPAAQKRTPML